MPRVGTLMRFAALSVVLAVTGCAGQTGDDLVAPNDVAPVQSCTSAVAGKRLSAKCVEVSWHTVRSQATAQRA